MTDLERARAIMRNSPPTLAEIANALAAARREGIEAAIAVMRRRVEAYRRVHDYIAADLLETNADAIRDLLLLDPEMKR